MSDHFQKELKFLGMESSPAFVRAPEGNGCAERFIRTLKENLLWLRTFETIEELRQALLDFKETYNTTWLIERHGFISPAQFRQQQLGHGQQVALPLHHAGEFRDVGLQPVLIGVLANGFRQVGDHLVDGVF